ncbi:MAG TPA: glycine cleavage system protein GcvH [Clostridiaceae bacterium]|nr:glycine cleavage system protein GcvH [Clostridiaceae bacterium]
MGTGENLYYSKDHEWVRVDGNNAYIGITDYAQDSLGSIVYVEMPRTGKAVSKGQVLGVVESVKAAADVYSPVSGTVTEINEALADNPGLINENPYENHIAVVSLDDPAELSQLMNKQQYEEYTKGA